MALSSQKYSLDGVSNIFPALGGHIYRFSAEFKEEIDIAILRDALKALVPYFPILFTHLNKTATGYVHVPATNFDVIRLGNAPIKAPKLTDTDKPAFRVHIDKTYLMIDFFHGNADGHIATAFLTALLENYSALKENAPLPTLQKPNPIDLENPYDLYYKKAKVSAISEKPSYKLHLQEVECNQNKLYSIPIELNALKTIAKASGHSINDFLCAVLYRSIYDATDAKDGKLPITISVAMDLRAMYQSNSHRNFAYFTNVRLPIDKADELNYIMDIVEQNVQSALEPNTVASSIASVHLMSNHPIVKYAPRAVKDSIIRAVYKVIDGKGITTTLSNLGYKKLSATAQKHIQTMEGFLSAHPKSLNALAIGYGDYVNLCVTIASKEDSIIKAIDAILKQYEIPHNIIIRR